MATKLEQAARQLLEVADGIQHGTDWNNGTHAKIYRPKFPAAITALREALSEPQITTPDVCGEVCARAKLCYGCGKALDEANAKYAEQERLMTDTELISANCRYTTPLMAEQAEQEPVSIANNAPNLFGQVYLTCRENGNSHEGSLAAADEAVRLHGDEAVSRQDLTLIVEQIVRG